MLVFIPLRGVIFSNPQGLGGDERYAGFTFVLSVRTVRLRVLFSLVFIFVNRHLADLIGARYPSDLDFKITIVSIRHVTSTPVADRVVATLNESARDVGRETGC